MAEKKGVGAGWVLRALNAVSQRPWGSRVEGEAAVPGGKQARTWMAGGDTSHPVSHRGLQWTQAGSQ